MMTIKTLDFMVDKLRSQCSGITHFYCRCKHLLFGGAKWQSVKGKSVLKRRDDRREEEHSRIHPEVSDLSSILYMFAN